MARPRPGGPSPLGHGRRPPHGRRRHRRALSAATARTLTYGSTFTEDVVVTIISRSEWGARSPFKPQRLSWKPWQGGVVIHHHGAGSWPVHEHDQCYGQMRSVQLTAMYPWPFLQEQYNDIPYSFVVCQHGGIFEGTGTQVRSEANGTQTVGANQDYYAVMGLIESEDQPSRAMLDSIRELIAHLRENHSAGPFIRGHRDVFDTECPGNLYPHIQGFYPVLPPGEPDPTPPKPARPLFLYSRSQWGARPPREVTRVDPGSRTGFTVHYSAGPASQTVRQIQNYHMDSNGWSDVGYNFLVDVEGRIYEGRGWDVAGAHATGHNTTHIGVCFIGEDGDATPRALSAIRALYNQANSRTGRTLAMTWHGGLSGQSTQCPGPGLRAWVQGGMNASTLPVHTGTGDLGGDSTGSTGGGMTLVRTIAAQQAAVNQLGYSPALEVDGVWGPKTDAGVRWLQQKVGAGAADGLWGPATEAAYAAHTGGSGSGTGSGGGGMTSVRSVKEQQQAVNALGYSPALEADGIWGPKTDAGVRWLQQKVGAGAADGLWGPATEAAYNGYLDNGAMLTVDGQWGPATIRATQKVIGVTADGQWGPNSVRGLQRHLNTWSNAGLVVDGAAGPATYKALQTHLNKMTGAGLAVDGAWGPATVRALQTALNRGQF
ncbi:peptidoglycan recognition protein [Streptomyces venezuelae]|uniref:Peptidoglycan recognition protein n=1 Tax=Streptomyces venezuelae TaxID=54571 RepID=A0A5P2DUH5_STRVZ|nr:peptidoglycan recognition protein [Streptomyces venezuelae]